MWVVVYLPLAFAACVAAAAALCAGPVSPRLATWMTVGAGVAAATSSVWALALLSAGFVERGVRVEEFSRLGAKVVPHTVSVVALVLLVIGGLRVVAACVRHWPLYRKASQASRADEPELIVVPIDEPVAFAWSAGGGRIVVSRGMLRRLNAAERRVLFAHERSHLRNHHHRFQLVADLCAGANPLLNRLRSDVEFTLERWADEDAAFEVNDRRLAARALARAATVSTDRHHRGHAGRLGFERYGVARRVAALLVDPRPRSVRATAATVALGGFGLLALAGATMATLDLIRITGH